MTQADSVHSTPPTNTSVDATRRTFLSQAAGVAVGSAVLGMALPVPAVGKASEPVPHPSGYGGTQGGSLRCLRRC